jgi:hypothetical protein
MKTLFLLFTIILSNKIALCQGRFDGSYIGFDSLPAVNNTVSTPRGYPRPGMFTRVRYLKIKGDKVFMDTRYADIKADTTIFDADGIYNYFDGTLAMNNSVVEFRLKEVVVNYFEQSLTKDKSGFPQVVRRANDFSGRLTAGGILIDGISFRKEPENVRLVSETPALFLERKGIKPPGFRPLVDTVKKN